MQNSTGSLGSVAKCSETVVPTSKKISEESIQNVWGDLEETKEDRKRCSWTQDDINDVKKTWKADTNHKKFKSKW
jgi:hypothetical protein